MYIFKNAFISVKRNKGRNILIGVIIMVIACACSISLAITNTASKLINSYTDSYQKEATISFDRSNIKRSFDMKDKESMNNAKDAFDNISSYTLEDIISYADSDYVSDYYYTYQIELNGKSIEKVSSDFSFGEKNDKNLKDKGMDSNYDFKLIGYSNESSVSEFINGTYKMTEIDDDAWNKIFTENYVFINSELASLNEISVNDTITLQDKDGNTYEFIVLGIFEEEGTSSEMPNDMFSNSANTIITGADYLVETFNENTSVKSSINPTFILKDYEDTDDFQNELYEKGLDKNYVIETNQEDVENSLSSISNIKSFAKTFLIITLTVGAIVLFVINMINIRERKYEIGVLRTIGISKVKLAMQFIFELVTVALIAVVIGTGVGALSSKSVGNYLLKNEINSTNEVQEDIANNMKMDREKGPMDNKNVKGKPVIEAYETMDAVVNIKVLLELVLISITLILISSVSAMISIERFSPLEILKER